MPTKTNTKNKVKPSKKSNSAEFMGEISQDDKGKSWLKGGISPVGRVLYPSVFNTKLNYNGNMKTKSGKQTTEEDREWCCTLLFKKSDPVLKSMEKKIKDLATIEFWVKGETLVFSSCIKDGDEKFQDDPEANEIYKGTRYIVVKRPANLEPPVVLDMNGDDMLSQKDFYAGCYARAQVTFKTYVVDKTEGVSCYWGSIKKIAEGDRLGFDQAKMAKRDFAKGSASVSVDDKGNVSY